MQNQQAILLKENKNRTLLIFIFFLAIKIKETKNFLRETNSTDNLMLYIYFKRNPSPYRS